MQRTTHNTLIFFFPALPPEDWLKPHSEEAEITFCQVKKVKYHIISLILNLKNKQNENRLRDKQDEWLAVRARRMWRWVKSVKGIERYKPPVIYQVSLGDLTHSIRNMGNSVITTLVTDSSQAYHCDHFTVVAVVQLLSCVWFFAIPWTAAHQASPSFTIFQSLPKFMSIGHFTMYAHVKPSCKYI